MPFYYIDPVNGLDTNDGLGWFRLAYTAGQTAAPGVGATITGGTSGATALILSVTLSSGTWAGNNAVGYFYLYGKTGAFGPAENITWTGGSCTASQTGLSQYPPAQNGTYVKSTTYYGSTYYPYFATDHSLSLTGNPNSNGWLSAATGSDTNQRFHIDLGSAIIINKVYYENYHASGGNTNQGVQHFTLWGSNNAAAFAELTYATDTNWTQLTCDISAFLQHSGADAADPRYIVVTNSTAYRYYAFKFADNYGGINYMGLRRIELQSSDAIYSSFKSIHKTFAAGDNIYVAKCAEAQQSGTGVCTAGSFTITGISGWTPAAYNVIRIQGDDTVYMVSGYGGGTITLYRPYRGTSGTKNINLLTLLPYGTASTDLSATGNGTLGNLINLNGGYNPATNAREGFSIWNGNNALYAPQHGTYWNISNFGVYYTSTSASPTVAYCTLTNIFILRLAAQNYFYSASGNLGNHINDIVIEGAGWVGCRLNESLITNLEIGNAGAVGLSVQGGGCFGTTFVNPKISGTPSVRLAISSKELIFQDATLDEAAGGGNNVDISGTGVILSNVIFRNPKVGSGPLFSLGGGVFTGQLQFQNVNGQGINYTYFGDLVSTSQFRGVLGNDDSTYHTAAPSARMVLPGGLLYPVTVRHYIPCDAGVTKTIGVYMMINATPGTTFTINAAGSGYAVGDYLVVNQASAGGCVLKVVTLSGSGVATVLLISGGYNYSVANGLTTTALTGGGSGCKINITGTGTGYGSVTLPIMRLRWFTGSVGALVSNSYDVILGNTPNVWSQLSHTVTPSVIGSIILELIFQSLNTGSVAWYDDISVV